MGRQRAPRHVKWAEEGGGEMAFYRFCQSQCGRSRWCVRASAESQQYDDVPRYVGRGPPVHAKHGDVVASPIQRARLAGGSGRAQGGTRQRQVGRAGAKACVHDAGASTDGYVARQSAECGAQGAGGPSAVSCSSFKAGRPEDEDGNGTSAGHVPAATYASVSRTRWGCVSSRARSDDQPVAHQTVERGE
jgi:hypothetical protein